jgi:hypothetical protein
MQMRRKRSIVEKFCGQKLIRHISFSLNVKFCYDIKRNVQFTAFCIKLCHLDGAMALSKGLLSTITSWLHNSTNVEKKLVHFLL